MDLRVPLWKRIFDGAEAYRISGLWVFYHPQDGIRVVEHPKARIDDQHVFLDRTERHFRGRESFDRYIQRFQITLEQQFDLNELTGIVTSNQFRQLISIMNHDGSGDFLTHQPTSQESAQN